MNLLDRLLTLIPVTGQLDFRCHFGTPWRIDEARAPDSQIAWHLLLSGTATVEHGDGPPVVMTAGDIVMFPAGHAHSLHEGEGRQKDPPHFEAGAGFTILRQGNGDSADVLCGRFFFGTVPYGLIQTYLPSRMVVRGGRQADGQAPAPGSIGDRLARLIALMRDETMAQEAGCEALVGNLSGALFAMTLRAASESDNSPRGLLALAREPRLQPALSAMFDTPERAWSLPDLAELCHMSRATFSRRFDEALGCSAHDFLTEIRMTLAGRKLAHTTASVADIGESVGYQSDAAFQRVFKKVVGVTPAQWRAQARQAERR
ncbi:MULTISPECIES: AraC family transcriptional regulator [Pandoraea]|uniref:cupin domain-containing protein n=1 Tax=Pandoraea TaxID=93217 RepID=UPI001F5D9F7F|nr:MULTISPECIES: AraC family transcriptional regulator [Pandoraea]MCI3208770.1 AraC family transcriptional regulator [Pandoraea sp. LA3]MDN4586799.1 AraC family transcriptional regulator [Pandoraea capi]